MSPSLRVMLVTGITLLGVPHLLCACSASRSVATMKAAACPHCHHSQHDSEPDQPRPCQCPQCDLIKVVPSDPSPSISSPDLTSSVCVVSVEQVFGVSSPRSPAVGGGVGPPGPALAPPQPLPILLGHLLF